MVTSHVRSEEMMKPHRDHLPGDDTVGARPAAEAPADDRVVEISHEQMDAAHNEGEAIPFAQSVPWLVRYDGSWWVVYERGWLRITDELTATDIDQRVAQLPEADTPDAARQ
jgi:hypothetical protein